MDAIKRREESKVKDVGQLATNSGYVLTPFVVAAPFGRMSSKSSMFIKKLSKHARSKKWQPLNVARFHRMVSESIITCISGEMDAYLCPDTSAFLG